MDDKNEPMSDVDKLSLVAGAGMVAFLVWLCTQMAITDYKAQLLLILGTSIAAVLAIMALPLLLQRRRTAKPG